MPRKRLPHDTKAEAALLSAVLLRSSVLAETGALQAEDFFDMRHAVLWDACCSIEKRGQPIDEVTLEAELQERQKLNAIGGLAFIGQLASLVVTADNASYYADIVKRHAASRRLLVKLSEAVDMGGKGVWGEELFNTAQRAVADYESVTDGFTSAAAQITDEAKERAALATRKMEFKVSFLDDFLRGLLPHDLVVIGAPTGVGKTQLVQRIAVANAEKGKRVYFLALEAEPREIERRTKFTVLANLAHELRLAGRHHLNYSDWYLGKCHQILPPDIEKEADKWIQHNLKTLYTLYRGTDFKVDDLDRHFRSTRGQADLIILDHLHYVDSDDPNENRAVKDIVKRIRDNSLAIGVPVIVVAHLRKRDRGRPRLVPDIDDFHGASDIVKIATAAIMLSRARDQESLQPWVANTYMQVTKSRRGGACPFVAMLGYDLRRNAYERQYMLGRLNLAGTEVKFLSKDEYPAWAVNGGNVADCRS